MKLLSTTNSTLLLSLAGIVNVEQELLRLKKEVDWLVPLIEQYKRKIFAPGYETKVPQDVQLSNAEKLASYESELETTNQAIAAFESMLPTVPNI
jgi:valyl-tRNA synthetase